MKVIALRGVCIGIDRHLKVDDTEDLDPATGKFLVSIGAVKEIVDEPPKPEAQPEPASDKESESKSKQKK